jgi:hypothetical protein
MHFKQQLQVPKNGGRKQRISTKELLGMGLPAISDLEHFIPFMV